MPCRMNDELIISVARGGINGGWEWEPPGKVSRGKNFYFSAARNLGFAIKKFNLFVNE